MKRTIISIGITVLFIVPVLASPNLDDGTGLMDSCWPMYQHNLKHTGRSPYAPEGDIPVVKWSYTMYGLSGLSESAIHSSPAIDNDGILYFGDSDFVDGCFYALYPNGTEKWKYVHDDWTYSSPAIAYDGTIYFGCGDGKLYSFQPDGTLNWKLKLETFDWLSSPAIGDDGTIYVGSTNNNFYAINPNGTIKWSYETGYRIFSSPAIDDEGIVYVGSHDNYLYSFYPNGTLNWKFKASQEVKSPPAIGDDGIIYVGSWGGNLYAINPNGTLKWKFSTGDAVETSPTIGYNGDIYVGSYNGKVFSINPIGIKNWEYQVGKDSEGWILASPVVDKNGRIYACSLDGYIYAFNPDGSVHWWMKTPRSIEPTPVIGEDGTLYYSADKFGSHPVLYALEMINNQPPETPEINGESSGNPNHRYYYDISTVDPDGDDVYYFVEWGEDTNSGWIGPYSSDEVITVNHTWSRTGTYEIRVKSRDIHNVESDWSSLNVIMPKYKLFSHPFFEFILDLFPVLRNIFVLII